MHLSTSRSDKFEKFRKILTRGKVKQGNNGYAAKYSVYIDKSVIYWVSVIRRDIIVCYKPD